MVLKNLDRAKQKLYENQVEFFIKGAQKYISMNEDITWESIGEGGQKKLEITLQNMADAGYFTLPIINPVTNVAFDPETTKVTAYRENNEYTYSYEDESTQNPNSIAPGLYVIGTTTLAKVTVNGIEDDEITIINDFAFDGCSNLTSITIPNSVTTIGKSAFDSVPHITYSGSATGTPWGALGVN